MWNFLVGALSIGAKIVLYDGSPLYPSPAYQIQLLEEQGYVRISCIVPLPVVARDTEIEN
jgi:acyl-coenzyme A synthetase/AMP-(fatty) acid ligase